VTDIKNVQEITNSTNKYGVKQLESFFDRAKAENLPFNLIISPNTKSISQTVVNMVKETNGRIFQFDPSIGKWSTIDISDIMSGGFKRGV
jgi:hypothetical protein